MSIKLYIFISIILQALFITLCLYIDIQPSTIKKFHQVISEVDGFGQQIYTSLAAVFIILSSESDRIKESFYCWLVAPFCAGTVYVVLFFLYIKGKINKFRNKQYFKHLSTKLVNNNIPKINTSKGIDPDNKIDNVHTSKQTTVEPKTINATQVKKKLIIKKSAL